MKHVLVAVAHPDDETIWCGGTLLKHKGEWSVKIISLCRKNDLDRAPKFVKACKEYGARCAMGDLDDEEPEKKLKNLEEVKSRLLALLARREFDIIFTHGERGEYGHNRHREVGRAVAQLIKEGELRCGKLMRFDYKLRGKKCVPNKRASAIVALNRRESAKKKLIMQNVYKFEQGSFEEQCCSKSESFQESDCK